MMKKILIFLILFVSVFKFGYCEGQKLTYERLIHSIAYVESKHNPKMVSRNKTYVGYLQISKICVREANNIVGFQKYTYDDRYDKNKSIEIFHIIQQKHNPTQNINLAIRLWNEGLVAKKQKYKETPYVKKVLNLYNTIYSHMEE